MKRRVETRIVADWSKTGEGGIATTIRPDKEFVSQGHLIAYIRVQAIVIRQDGFKGAMGVLFQDRLHLIAQREVERRLHQVATVNGLFWNVQRGYPFERTLADGYQLDFCSLGRKTYTHAAMERLRAVLDVLGIDRHCVPVVCTQETYVEQCNSEITMGTYLRLRYLEPKILT